MTAKRKLAKVCGGRFYWSLMAVLIALLVNSGCSVYMAAKQPGEKDLSVLKPGNHRSLLIAELGAPVWSGEKEGEKTDVFVFKQGYSAGARTARALFHGTADVFTLGLWEVISTPTEAYFSGSDVKVEVVYDSKELVKTARNLSPAPVEPETKPSKVSPAVQSAQPSEVLAVNDAPTGTPTAAEP